MADCSDEIVRRASQSGNAVLFLLFIVGSMASPIQTNGANPEEVNEIVRSMTTFSLDLYGQLSKENPDENLFFSPISIYTVLGMVYAGARGITATQMSDVLHFDTIVDVPSSFSDLLRSLNRDNASYVLSTANRIYVDERFEPAETFLDVLNSSYQSEVTNVNFVDYPEDARHRINQWVEEKTANKIKNLIPKGGVARSTAMVLVNAIYFTGNWQRKFQARSTNLGTFHVAGNKKIQMDMMSEKARFPFGEIPELACHILELPYVQNDISLVIMLPNQRDGLTRLEEGITPAILQSVNSVTRNRTVIIGLPKCKLEENYELSKFLVKQGMSDLFDARRANLSGINDRVRLTVSRVFHKAFVEVEEEGTEAAAATAIVMGFRTVAFFQPPPTFIADHPFFFFIRHNKSGAILFMGRLLRPKDTSA